MCLYVYLISILKMTHVNGSLLSGSIHERLDELNEGLFDHLVLSLSHPVLVVSHDEKSLAVVGAGHVRTGVQHADSELLGVGVTDLTLVSEFLGDEILKSVG